MRYTNVMRPVWGVWEGKHRILTGRDWRRIRSWMESELRSYSLYTEADSP